MNRPAARVRVNDALDCLMQNAPRLTPDQLRAMPVQRCAMPDVVEAQRSFNASLRATLDRLTSIPVPDHFGDEGLTLAQKRRREEMLHVD